jgi:UDP-N-acetylglucosamine 1-carboxyvinyltransferase
MGTFKINGGKKLNGTITPQGAKNETLQILCAVLANTGRSSHHEHSRYRGCQQAH